MLLALRDAMDSEVPHRRPAISGDAVADGSIDDPQDRRRRRMVANRAFGAIKTQHAAELSRIEAAADWLNQVAASTPFLVFHVLWFLVWMTWNTGRLGLTPFDPFPFGLLTMVVSLEAIFLSIFVLMAQQRESSIAELREEIALQVGLRLEEEVTKTLQLVAGLYTRLGLKLGEDPELHQMLQPLDVAAIERELLLQIATAAQMRRRQRASQRATQRATQSGSTPP